MTDYDDDAVFDCYETEYELGYRKGRVDGFEVGYRLGLIDYEKRNKKIEEHVEEPKVCVLCGIPFETLHEWTCVHPKCPHNMH